jgi:TonB family protein
MSKFSFSFGIAVGIHIVVLLPLILFIKKSEPIVIDSRNLIELQINRSSGQTKKSTLFQPKNSQNLPSTTVGSIDNSIKIGNDVTTDSITNENVGSENNFEATILNYQPPVYPHVAQVRGLQGVTRIRIHVTSEGMPGEIILLKSSGHDVLDKAALEVIPRWRFQTKNSTYFVEKNIVFRLNN